MLAIEVAERFLDDRIRPLYQDEVVIASVTEFDSFWAFGYNTRALVEHGDMAKSLLGNGPVVVPKDGGVTYLAESSVSIEEQIGPALGSVSFLGAWAL